MKMKRWIWFLIIGLIFLITVVLCLLLPKPPSAAPSAHINLPGRESLIPADAIKMTPQLDDNPPRSHSPEYADPTPLPYPVNTRGAEDSAFILPDGNTLYVWFTPNNRMDAVEQSQDLVTGIYMFEKQGDDWSDPERIWFVEPGAPHLDGCAFFQGDKVWICGVRAGLEGMHWFTSTYQDGKWSIAELADFAPEFEVGELHISNDGNELYFHSSRAGGKGGLDIWVSQKVNGEWTSPVNLEKVNSEYDEGWPALNPAEDELWISRNYGLWRSKKVNGEWQVPELIFSPLAGEATIDWHGNVYFTHHYYQDDRMIEADIFVAYKN